MKKTKGMSNRQRRADMIRWKGRFIEYHGWNLSEMSNNQVLRLYKQRLIEVDKQ